MKFRVYDKQEKKYVDLKNNPLWMDNEGDFYFISDLPCCSCEGMSFYSDRYVVEFSTGLKDKNGVEIFEGDQVRCEYGYCGSPKMHNRTIIYIAEYKQGQYYGLCDSEIYSMEIIGNIHGETDGKD